MALGLFFDNSSNKDDIASENLVPSFNDMLDKISYIEFANNQGSSIIENIDKENNL